MPMTSRATEEDWAAVREHWARGFGFGACSKLIEGRAGASTIRRHAEAEGWVRESGEPAVGATAEQRRASTEAATEANRRRWVQEKDRVVDKLVGLVDRLIEEVHSPMEVIDVKVVGGAKDMGAEVQTIRTWIPTPVPADKQRLVTSAAIVIDKLQLLTGEATSRTEQLGDREAAVARAKQLRDELAERRTAHEAQAAAEAAKTG